MKIREMTIREMTLADIPALKKIYLDARVDAFYWWPDGSFKLDDFDESTEGEWVLVAELDGKIVGFSSSGSDYFLHNFFVARHSPSPAQAY